MKKERAREREREIVEEMIRNELEKEKKVDRGKEWDTCVVEKNQEKRKRKGYEWMIERKEGKIKFRNATIIFLQ